MTLDPVGEIKVGQPIYTRDGEKIGDVKEVRDEYIKVDAALQPDYWLRRDLVLSYTTERVTMTFDKADLPGQKVEPPREA